MDDRKLTLLGRWAETPLIAFPGYCDAAQERFQELTGFRPAPFTLLREDLHEQYYLEGSVEPLKSWFDGLAAEEKMQFTHGLYDAYYVDAAVLQEYTNDLAGANLAEDSLAELRTRIEKWKQIPGRLAGPIFFSVLLDVWYPERTDLMDEIKSIAGQARDHCSDIYDIQAKAEAERLFLEAAYRLGVAWDDLQLLFPDEILSWLDGNSRVQDKISPRRDFFVTTNVDDRYSILEEQSAADQVLTVDLAELGERNDHMLGLGIYPGIVQGRGVRILHASDVDQFRDGDILVAYQTSVWYEPLFDRSAAVVTELGGATSHAAVVCSERHVPCVVGVRNLIRSVDSGDIIRVDSATGSIDVVRRDSSEGA